MNHPQTIVETFPYGICRAWIDDKRIVMFQASSEITDDAGRLWEHLVVQTIQQWPENRAIFLMQDLSQPDAISSHAARSSNLNVILREGQVAYSAIVIGDGRVKRLLSRVTRVREGGRSTCQERVFASREAAYAWLRSVISSDGTPAVAAAI